MKLNQKGFSLLELIIVSIIVCIVLPAATGWGMNIHKLTQCDFKHPYKTEVVRVIGIIPPVGAIVGWMGVGEEED